MENNSNNTTQFGNSPGKTNEMFLNQKKYNGSEEIIMHKPDYKFPINLGFFNYNANESKQGPTCTKAPINDLNALYKKNFPGDEFDEKFFEQLKAKNENMEIQVRQNLERQVNANQNKIVSNGSSISVMDMVPISQCDDSQLCNSKKAFPKAFYNYFDEKRIPKSYSTKYNTEDKTESIFDKKSPKTFSRRFGRNMTEFPTYQKPLPFPLSKRFQQNMAEGPKYDNS